LRGLRGEPQAGLWFGEKIVKVQAVGEIKNKGTKIAVDRQIPEPLVTIGLRGKRKRSL